MYLEYTGYTKSYVVPYMTNVSDVAGIFQASVKTVYWHNTLNGISDTIECIFSLFRKNLRVKLAPALQAKLLKGATKELQFFQEKLFWKMSLKVKFLVTG